MIHHLLIIIHRYIALEYLQHTVNWTSVLLHIVCLGYWVNMYIIKLVKLYIIKLVKSCIINLVKYCDWIFGWVEKYNKLR